MNKEQGAKAKEKTDSEPGQRPDKSKLWLQRLLISQISHGSEHAGSAQAICCNNVGSFCFTLAGKYAAKPPPGGTRAHRAPFLRASSLPLAVMSWLHHKTFCCMGFSCFKALL